MVDISPTISMITLNVNEVNILIKRQRLLDWIKRPDPTKWCLQVTHLRFKDTNRLEMKEWKKMYHAKRNNKNAGVAIVISDKKRL